MDSSAGRIMSQVDCLMRHCLNTIGTPRARSGFGLRWPLLLALQLALVATFAHFARDAVARRRQAL